MAYDWVAFTKEFGLVLGLLSLPAMGFFYLLFYLIRRSVSQEQERIGVAVERVTKLYKLVRRREKRCKVCAQRYEDVSAALRDRCDLENCTGLKRLESKVDKLAAVADRTVEQFSETTTGLLGIIRTRIGGGDVNDPRTETEARGNTAAAHGRKQR